MDYLVGEVQCDFIQRKIRVLDLLGEYDLAIAIVARKRSGSVGTYGEFPDLKFLGGNRLVVGLNDRDFVEKPIRAAVLGNVLRAVGVENVAVDSVPIPGFAAGKLREIGIAAIAITLALVGSALAKDNRRHQSAEYQVGTFVESQSVDTGSVSQRRQRWAVRRSQCADTVIPVTTLPSSITPTVSTQLTSPSALARLCSVVVNGSYLKRLGLWNQRTPVTR